MQLARQGSYDKALAMLLEPNVWRGLSLHDYVSWAHEIWHILALRATRRYVVLMWDTFLFAYFKCQWPGPPFQRISHSPATVREI
jgi:hypothetical protein